MAQATSKLKQNSVAYNTKNLAIITMAASLPKARPEMPNQGGSIQIRAKSISDCQRLYDENPSKVIKAILDGSFGKPPPESLPDKTMDDFWRSKFESLSVLDDRHFEIPPTLDALAEKITLDEFKTMRKTLDADLCIFYNLFLLHSTTPTTLT